MCTVFRVFERKDYNEVVVKLCAGIQNTNFSFELITLVKLSL